MKEFAGAFPVPDDALDGQVVAWSAKRGEFVAGTGGGSLPEYNASNYPSLAAAIADAHGSPSGGGRVVVPWGSPVANLGTIGVVVPNGVELDCHTPLSYSGTGAAVTFDTSVAFKHRIAVQRTTHAWDTGVDTTSIGVLIRNCVSCSFEVWNIANFCTNLEVRGDTNGSQDNEIHLGNIVNGKINLLMSSIGGGWSNHNLYTGGWLQHTAGMASYAGTREISDSNIASTLASLNKFDTVDLEGGLVERTIDISGAFNIFSNCDFEGGSIWLEATAAGTMFDVAPWTNGAVPFHVTAGGSYIVQSEAPGTVLGLKQYRPVGIASYVTTPGTVLATVDVANMTVKFTAPTSGQVLVKLSANAAQSAAGSYYWGLMDHTTHGTYGDVWMIEQFGTAGIHSISKEQLITGLVPGQVYQFDWGHGSTTNPATLYASANAAISAGAIGPALMKVTAA